MTATKTNERPGTRAVHRHSGMSASKARQVLDLIRGQDVQRAAEILNGVEREAAEVIGKVLQRAGLQPSDVALWEINEAFASVPIAACREYGLNEELVNFSGSGCSLGHPIAASGARMITTLVYELQRRGGGIGVAAMCAGGGQGGAVVIEV